MIKNNLLFVFAIFIQLAVHAQSKQDKQVIKKIDELIAKQLDKISPGCAVLVSKKGKVFYKKAFGLADIELNVPMDADMVFKIASVTKQFTAIAILQLVEQGKILLTDSIQKYIKGFPIKERPVTIENLLTQTSGITEYLDMEVNVPNALQIEWAPGTVIDSLKKQRLEFAPNTKFAYSNSNYFILGHIIELVTGKTYAEYLQQNIFTPLGLKNTFYSGKAETIANKAKGYDKKNDKYVDPDITLHPSLSYSAGGIMSNVENLFKWNEAVMNYKLVKEETLKKAFTPYQLPNGELSEYGHGWYIRNIAGSGTIEHGGSVYGFRAQEIYLPEEKIYVVGLFNCRQLDTREKDLCVDIVKTMLGKPLIKDSILSDHLLNSYTGTYQLTNTPTRTIVITKEKDHLIANIVGQGNWIVLFQTDTKFIIHGVNATCEFINENGRTTKMIIQQNGEFIWQKIK